MENVLSIDCGTQGLRAFLINSEGRFLKTARVAYEPYFSKKAGWAEQDPDVYWNALVRAVKRITDRLTKEEMHSIVGLVLTTQRASLIVVDENGSPLRNAIVWLDQRKAKFDAKIPVFRKMIYKFVKMYGPLKLAQAEAKINWIRQNEPEVFKRAYKFLFLSGYLNYKLTGKFVDSKASQVGYLPFDHKKRDWADDKDLKSLIFPVPRRKLVDLIEPGERLGTLTKKTAELLDLPSSLPVVASASDKSCETLGMGATDEETASLSFGTTATIQVMTERYFEPLKYMPSYVAAIPGYYNPEIEIFRGFWMLKWFKEEFGAREVEKAMRKGIAPEEFMDIFLREVPPGSQGLIVQPYWTPGLKMPEAKGAMIGFGSMHTRAHIYKAIVEGLGYALRDGKNKIEKAGKIKISRLTVSGGGAQSDEICQIMSDIFDLPVYRGETHEASALGAAIDAFVGLGVHDDFKKAVEKMVRYAHIFKPNEENASMYSMMFHKVYERMYSKLKPLYKALKK